MMQEPIKTILSASQENQGGLVEHECNICFETASLEWNRVDMLWKLNALYKYPLNDARCIRQLNRNLKASVIYAKVSSNGRNILKFDK